MDEWTLALSASGWCLKLEPLNWVLVTLQHAVLPSCPRFLHAVEVHVGSLLGEVEEEAD